MSLFTLEIEGRPVMVFASEDEMAADQFTQSPSLHEDLMCLAHEGRRIWDGKSELFVRQAQPEEASTWDVAFARARRNGNADASDKDDYAVFLLSVTDVTDVTDE